MAIVNLLLNALHRSSLARIQAGLEFVRLSAGEILIDAAASNDWLYFVEDGLVSIVSEYGSGRLIEVGMIGREGVFDPGVILGDDLAAFRGTVQVEGAAYRLPRDMFRQAMAADNSFSSLMLKYARTFELQVAATASANGRALLEERLARWLIMVHDRTDSQILHITHEFLSQMLCTRRPGVTVALQLLEGKGLIASTRGQVEIRNREGLIEVANGAYGSAESQYARLLGWDFRRRMISARRDTDGIEKAN